MALRRTIVFSVILLMLVAAPVWASPTGISDLPRVQLPVNIDGKLDDAAWSQALQIDLDTETHPGENIPARVKTVAYLMEDADLSDAELAELKGLVRELDAQRKEQPK